MRIQLLLRMCIQGVRANPLLQQVQALAIRSVWLWTESSPVTTNTKLAGTSLIELLRTNAWLHLFFETGEHGFILAMLSTKV